MTVDDLLTMFRHSLAEQLPVDEALDGLLKSTGARAVGLWRVRDDLLVQVGFRTVRDMPLEVQTGFAAATAWVPLSNTELGIVKAVTSRQPSIATLDSHDTGLTGSASWLARFRTVQSAAFPIFDANETVTGVLAISTPVPIERGDVAWQIMTALVSGLQLS